MKKHLLVLWLIFLSLNNVAQPVATLSDSTYELILMPNELMYIEDRKNEFTFEQISSPAFQGQFKVHPNYLNKDFVPNASYWIRLPLRFNSSKNTWLLEFYDQTIDNIWVYVPQKDGTYQCRQFGDRLPFNARSVGHKNFELIINNFSVEKQVYFFKIQSHEFADLRVALHLVNRFINYATNEYFLYGIFYGLIALVVLYNLLTYMAGVQIISNSQPGTSPQIRVRVVSTALSGTTALYVVDGVLTDDISNINTSDIVEMNVLKDASAAAIYGSRGANGVIIITTKKGAEGKMKISYSNNIGIRQASNLVKKTNSAESSNYLPDDLATILLRII